MITVIGSLNMDLVVNTKRIPRPGETVMGTTFKQIPGGKGANQADAIAKLAGSVTMIGAVGDDEMGKTLVHSLKKDGVTVDHVMVKPQAATGVASIIVDGAGHNSITVAPGANYQLTAEDIQKKKSVIQGANLVLVQLETPLEVVEECLRIAGENGNFTILNPAPAAQLTEDLLKHVNLLTPNETELETLSGCQTDSQQGIEEGAKVLLRQGVRALLVTLGEKGCLYVRQEKGRILSQLYAAYPVQAVDSTAAGDSFNGALALALSQGKTMDESIRYGMLAGALTVTREGAQTSLPTIRDIEEYERRLRL